MSTALHEQARTTPHVRARRNGVTAPTLYQWKRRTEVQDRLRAVHRLQTTLTRRREAPAAEGGRGVHLLSANLQHCL